MWFSRLYVEITYLKIDAALSENFSRISIIQNRRGYETKFAVSVNVVLIKLRRKNEKQHKVANSDNNFQIIYIE